LSEIREVTKRNLALPAIRSKDPQGAQAGSPADAAAGQIPVGDQRQAAKALRLKVPQSLLAQANEVIE